jgi:hypothetical protein
MPSVEGLKTRKLLARGETITKRTDTGVALRLRYIGTGTVTSITVTTATNIVMITSDGGTDTYAFATYTTVGALADAINTDKIFECVVLDTLRSYATASQFVDGAITASSTLDGELVWDVKTDTDACYYIAVCLDPKYREFDRPGSGHRVSLIGYEYSTNFNAAGANCEQVWIRRGAVEEQKIGRLSVDTTLTSRTFGSGNSKLTAPDDAQIIVLVKDAATTWSNATSDYVQADGEIE